MNNTCSRPPHCHHYFFRVQAWFREMFWCFILVQPLAWPSPVVVLDPFFITCHDSIKKWFILVAQQKRIANFKTPMFLALGQFVRYPRVELFNFTNLFEMANDCWVVNTNFSRKVDQRPKMVVINNRGPTATFLVFEIKISNTKFLEPSLHCTFTDASFTPNNIDVTRSLSRTSTKFELVKINLTKILFWHGEYRRS